MKKLFSIIIFSLILFLSASQVPAVSFLEEEAGISASINITGVDLSLAETAFKNIEKKTPSYIVGSVALDDYGESHDVHVYVDSTGHMVAYYQNTEPASKIIDWKNYSVGPMTLAGSKLEDALTKVCTAMYLSLPAVNYFDFRFPAAENIQIIVDEQINDGSNNFNLEIPGSYIIYNRAYSHAIEQTAGGGHGGLVYLDGTIFSNITGGGWVISDGVIDPLLLLPDVSHAVTIQSGWTGNGYFAIVLQYSVP